MKNPRKRLASAFITISCLSLIFAFCCFGMDNGDHEDNEYYGGDAYTGIQQAAAQTANNIQTLTENITTIGGYILLLTGMTFAAIGWYELQIISEKEKNQEDNFPENSAEPQKKDASSEEAL